MRYEILVNGQQKYWNIRINNCSFVATITSSTAASLSNIKHPVTNIQYPETGNCFNIYHNFLRT